MYCSIGSKTEGKFPTKQGTSMSTSRSLNTNTSRIIHEIAESVGVLLKEKQLSALTIIAKVTMSLLHFPRVMGYGKSVMIFGLLLLHC